MSGWLLRHKVLSALFVLVLVAIGLGEGDDEPVPDTTNGRVGVDRADKASNAAGTSPKPSNKQTATKKDRDPRPRQKSPDPKPAPRVRTYLVTHVVDGDTVELGNGEHVRLVGIDTPEQGDCNYDAATALMERLVLGRQVRLSVSDEDRDGYGRLLRYVDVGATDAGLRMIDAGFAVARYDSRDGYGYHPRENRYVAADTATANKSCPNPTPDPRPKPVPLMQTPAGSCEPGYDPCVPPYPPDLDCADVDGPILVTGSDPHGLDGEGDGIACE